MSFERFKYSDFKSFGVPEGASIEAYPVQNIFQYNKAFKLGDSFMAAKRKRLDLVAAFCDGGMGLANIEDGFIFGFHDRSDEREFITSNLSDKLYPLTLNILDKRAGYLQAFARVVHEQAELNGVPMDVIVDEDQHCLYVYTDNLTDMEDFRRLVSSGFFGIKAMIELVRSRDIGDGFRP